MLIFENNSPIIAMRATRVKMFPTNPNRKPSPACLQWLADTLGTNDLEVLSLPEHAHKNKHHFTVIDPHTEKTHLLVETLDDHESTLKFSSTAKILRQNGICVPQIHHQKITTKHCWMIMTHFGNETMLNWLSKPHNQNHKEQLLDHCLEEIDGFQKVKTNYPVPNYDHTDMLADIHLCDKHFFSQLLETTMNDQERAYWAYCKQIIIEEIKTIPKSLVHFDFHSANIMLLPKKTLGILDFQDMKIGPINYDLASLLTDHYVHHDDLTIKSCIKKFYKNTIESRYKNQLSEQQMIKLTHIVAIQRHLKNIGIFSRLFFNHKEHYIKHIPGMMHRLKYLCRDHQHINKLPDILWSPQRKNRFIEGIVKHCKTKGVAQLDDILSTVHVKKFDEIK